MVQKEFAQKAVRILSADPAVLGLAAAGSWISNELDEFSDLDLILITKDKISADKNKMLAYAGRLGTLLTGFTGEHVGEPRLLICLYDQPLLHVDIKFLTLEEFRVRIETPVILLDTDNQLAQVLAQTEPVFPYPDYQWIEDRFWIWVHYILLKTGRGENLEAFDAFGFLRMVIFGPLLHIHNGGLPRGVRRVETALKPEDLDKLHQTIPQGCNKAALLTALHHSVALYRELRANLYGPEVQLQQDTEEKVMAYLTLF